LARARALHDLARATANHDGPSAKRDIRRIHAGIGAFGWRSALLCG
jgi:hypothetical protein